MSGEELFGAAVVGLEVGVDKRPGRGDAAFVMKDAEVFGAQTKECGTVDLCLATDKVGLLGVERLIVFVEPDVFGVIVIVDEDGGRAPVEFFLREEGTALEDEDALACLREVKGECASAGSASNDDGIVLVWHGRHSCCDEGCDSFLYAENWGRVKLWGGGAGFFAAGQEEREDGAVMDGMLGTTEGKAAAVTFDNASADPQPEAGAVEVLRSVEGFEDAATDGG